MERTARIAQGTGKVILALLGGILVPILIWVALGIALERKTCPVAVRLATA